MSDVPFPGNMIEFVRNVTVTYKGTVGTPLAISDVSKIARSEPVTIISSTLTGTPELYEVLHGVLNIYTAYYLQAIGILSAELTDVRILKILDKVNPDRDMKTILAAGYTAYESISNRPANLAYNMKTLSLDGCKYRLPMLNSDKQDKFAMEHILEEDDTNHLGNSINKIETFEKLGVAVGKAVEVKFKVSNNDTKTPQEVSIPVVVKLDTMIMDSSIVKAILVSNKDEITFSSRLRDAMAGRINFIKDFILCSDLIKSQKRTMIKDSTGIYTQLLKRINNSRLYSALTGNISVAGISAIVVLSNEDEAEVQRALGGKLTNLKIREMVFANTSAMMIVVLDKEWERVTIYVRDITSYSQAPFTAFKAMAGKGDNNIMEILKAFSVNSSPSF